MRMFLLLFFIPFLAACDQHYRYTCQDVSNWDKEECKKPRCEVHKTCPEHIFGENFNSLKGTKK